METPYNIFRPYTEPARRLYDTFHKEAAFRKDRTHEQWMAAEQAAVLQEALTYLKETDPEEKIPRPTSEDVRKAELTAAGHSGYSLKFACAVARLITP